MAVDVVDAEEVPHRFQLHLVGPLDPDLHPVHEERLQRHYREPHDANVRRMRWQQPIVVAVFFVVAAVVVVGGREE